MNNKITTSAPGKLMLLGEHAVVYGRPCLVTAVTVRIHVTVSRQGTPGLTVNAPQTKDLRFIEKAVFHATRSFGASHDGLHIETVSPFTGVYGFGSSSAVTTAAVYAIGLLSGRQVSPRQTFDISYDTVMDVQGVGSGFDVAAASYGGTVYYRNGDIKTIEAVPFLSGHTDAHLVIGYSGVKSSTVELVTQVAANMKTYPEKVTRIFDAIADLVSEGKAALEKSDYEKFGKIMDFNQEYLRDLGVSSGKLEDLISAARRGGAWGAKLSGAGGGDCMIAIASSDKLEAVREAITRAGGEVVNADPDAQGVRIETTDNQAELFVVVDKNDNILGFRSRADCHGDTSLIHRAAGVAVFDSGGRVLLQKRSLTKDVDPGVWALSSAGHVKKDEDYETCARRELKEELGISAPVVFAGKFFYRGAHETEMDSVFTATYDGPFIPNSEEVEEIRFFTKDELLRKLLSGEIKLSECAYQSLKTIRFL
jgi:mevalonate kinase